MKYLRYIKIPRAAKLKELKTTEYNTKKFILEKRIVPVQANLHPICRSNLEEAKPLI